MKFLDADLSGAEGLTVDETIEAALEKFSGSILTNPLTVTDYHTLRNFMQIVARKAHRNGIKTNVLDYLTALPR